MTQEQSRYEKLKEVLEESVSLTTGESRCMTEDQQHYLASIIHEIFTPKPTEGRLLSEEEQIQVIINKYPNKEPAIYLDDGVMDTILEAQRDLTASILEPQCQARVGRIFKEIEKHRVCDPVTGELKGYWLSPEEIEALKKGGSK